MQIHELTQLKENQINEIDLVGPNSIFNKARAATTAIKSGGGKFKDPNNTYQTALNQQYQQAAAKAAAGLRAQGYTAAAPEPEPAPASTATTPQAPAEPMRLGGQTLNPNNPADAEVIARIQAAQQQAPARPATPTPQPTAAQPATPAGAVYTRPNTAPAVATRPNTAPAVQTGGAQAIMTQTEFNAALRQSNLSRNQIDALAKQLQTTPGMAQALLKALGLAK